MWCGSCRWRFFGCRSGILQCQLGEFTIRNNYNEKASMKNKMRFKDSEMTLNLPHLMPGP